MAPSFASAAAQPIGFPVTEKLTRSNHAMWKPQVWSALRGAQLAGYVDGTIKEPAKTVAKSATDNEQVPNPAYATWEAHDQQVLHYLLASLSRDILLQVSDLATSREVWVAIEAMLASQSRAWVIDTRMALATTQKGTMTATEYYTKMKGLADEMGFAGKKLEDEEFISYVLAGLDIDYNPLVSAMAARVEPITSGELYTQLISFKQRLDLLHGGGSQLSTNMASRGGRNGNGRGRGGSGRGRGGGGRGRGDQNGGNDGKEKVVCQLCNREGHTVLRCYKRFDHSFNGVQEN